MPDLKRIPVKLNCKGVDLQHTVDEIPEGFYTRLNNVRALQQGEIQARPGTAVTATAGNPTVHTVRRLNNLLPGAVPDWTLFTGNGAALSSGQSGALAQIATGFSGNPLSTVAFRPENSPESYMYFGDSLKMVKANVASTVRDIGVLPPQNAPTTEYGQPAFVGVADGQNIAGWGFSGASTAITLGDRTNGDGATLAIGSILYNSGTSGWACINPSFTPQSWTGERMKVTLGGTEDVVVREIHVPIVATTIASIAYDSGMSGACTIVLTTSQPDLSRNSLLRIAAAETVRVLAVIPSVDGVTYAVRCVTAATRATGNAVAGLLSWYVYTVSTHAAAELITSSYIAVAQPAAGVGAIGVKVNENAGSVQGRMISLQDDYLHVSLFFQNPQNIVTLLLLIDIDPDTPAGTAFTNNYLVWTLTQAELGSFGTSSGNVWVELIVPLSQGVRHGNNPTLNMTGVKAVGVSLESSAACAYGFDWWYNFGTYGPDSGLGNPTGAFWRYRYRDTRTGARGVPSPQPYHALFPLREEVVVTVAASADAQVNDIDIERIGAGVDSYTYIGSTTNANGSFNDTFDATSLAGNPGLETDVFKPFLVEDQPWTGTVNVVGNKVTWVSGTVFSTVLAPGTEITIGGIATQVYTMPADSAHLLVTASLGTLTGAAYSVASPSLMGQPLRTIFGPLAGPTASFVFGLGDPRNPGLLYWMNGNDADSQGQANFIEITPPSEPLVCGVVWGSVAFVASEQRVFLVQPSYTNSGNLFIQTQLTAASGCHSPWGMAAGVDGVYMLGRDGVYLLTQNGANYLSKALWPLWPHEGRPAQATNGYNPVDMSQEQYLRLEYADSSVWLTFKDTVEGVLQTWRMAGEGLEAVFSGDPGEFRRGWFWEQYSPAVLTHYFEEVANGTTPRLLKGTVSSTVVAAGNYDDDSGNAIACRVRSGSWDLGDPRTQKLYMDVMNELAGTATLTLGFNRFSTTLAPVTIASTGRGLTYSNVATLAANSLVLRQDIAAQWDFTPGTLLYEFQASFYVQPFYGYELTTQLLDCGMPGWKQLRYRRIAVISTAAVTLTIVNDDGTVLASQNIASTGAVLVMSFDNLPNAAKGRMLRFSLTSGTPFAAFPADCFVRVKKWGGKAFVELAPFAQG